MEQQSGQLPLSEPQQEQSGQQEQQRWPADCLPFGEYSSRSELIGWESIGSTEEESRAAPVMPVKVSENQTGLGSLVSPAERLPNPSQLLGWVEERRLRLLAE